MPKDYELPAQFYLGREYDIATKAESPDPLMYDSKDLTTHALCVGMTGSGKTGLCLALLEEAAIDGIPAIIVDPKGDLGNLLLTFPGLKKDDFLPWVDKQAAMRKGLTVEQFAEETAVNWKKGLASWGMSPERIKKFREAADVAIYTPGSTAGLPLTVLRSFSAPGPEVLNDVDALRERVSAAAAGLLALLGLEGDPLRSREHILVSNLFDKAWREGRDLSLSGLIREIQTPSFDKLGVMDLESVFPQKDRFELSMGLNNILASPGFSAWTAGEALDVQRLLWTEAGKPRLSIISIAHLSDTERMFFLTILLNEVIAWMRSQPGTSSLRALFYMDEVFGYFPPSRNPPTKTPMLTLLKQARAFGLGIVLATQNPVDLDYKGLSNCGTWFLGRLQTERDKARVLDGLEGASSAAGHAFDRASMEQTLSALGARVFLLNNVHEDAPVVFKTRWALSYLCGPMSREQISNVMSDRKAARPKAASPVAQAAAASVSGNGNGGVASGARPVVPPGVVEAFLPRQGSIPNRATLVYRPGLLGTARVHFTHTASGFDAWETLSVLNPCVTDVNDAVWEVDAPDLDAEPELEKDADPPTAAFAALPSDLSKAKAFDLLSTFLKNHFYRTQARTVYRCKSLKELSRPGETEGDFKARLSIVAREERDRQIEKLRMKYAPKVAALQEQHRRAQQKLAAEKEQAGSQTMQTMLNLGGTILGGLLGRKVASTSNFTKAASTIRSGTKIMKERADIANVEENIEAIEARKASLEEEFSNDARKVDAEIQADLLDIDEIKVQAKKADLFVSRVVLVWTPWFQTGEQLTPAFE